MNSLSIVNGCVGSRRPNKMQKNQQSKKESKETFKSKLRVVFSCVSPAAEGSTEEKKTS